MDNQTGVLQEKPVSYVFILLYALTFMGFWMALLLPPTMTIAIRVTEVAPESKEQVLSLLMGVGAIVAMLANPIAGQLSDRTAARFGMRKPWLLGGMLVGSLGQLMMASGGVWMLTIGWWTVQLGFNASLAALMAIMPDQVPEQQRGRISGILGVTLQIGLVIGMFCIEHLKLNAFWMFMLPDLVFVGAATLFLFSFKDRQLQITQPPFDLGAFIKNFWIDPRKSPDFSWAFLSRFLMWIGLATLLTYQVFFLMEVLKIAPANIPATMFKAMLFTTGATLVGSLFSGWLSDLLKRRKIFVSLSAIIYGLGLYVTAISTSIDMFYLASSITGFGAGIYVAVDMALVTQVLPDPNNASKDLGIFNLANALPQSIAPAIAPIFLAINAVEGQSNYVSLFTAAACWALLGGAVILFVRKVK